MNPEYIDAGDIVAAQFTGVGANDGPFGSMKPTGCKTSLPFCEIFHFDKEGRMVSGNCYYDQYTLLTQLGHLQSLAAAGFHRGMKSQPLAVSMINRRSTNCPPSLFSVNSQKPVLPAILGTELNVVISRGYREIFSAWPSVSSAPLPSALDSMITPTLVSRFMKRAA